jgi:hypothetical protein
MADHSDYGFAREQSPGKGGPVLLGQLFEKEKHHVLHGHPAKMTADVVVLESGDSLTTAA